MVQVLLRNYRKEKQRNQLSKRFRGVNVNWTLHNMTSEEAYQELQGAWKESSTHFTQEELPDFLRKKLDS